jgi:hypothetical protein
VTPGIRPGYRFESIDEAAEELREVARDLGIDRVELVARADGRVEIRGETGVFNSFVLRAHVEPDALPNPAEALARHLDGEDGS